VKYIKSYKIFEDVDDFSKFVKNINLKNKWYNDPNFDSDNLHIITFESIPKNSIELIYKGTGESE
jgi:hypothetical protein